MTEKTATEIAIESYQKDARFRAIAQSCVAAAMQDHGPVDPERAQQGAHDIALMATACLLQRIYTEDAELNATRAERDRYREMALQGLNLLSPATSIDSYLASNSREPTRLPIQHIPIVEKVPD